MHRISADALRHQRPGVDLGNFWVAFPAEPLDAGMVGNVAKQVCVLGMPADGRRASTWLRVRQTTIPGTGGSVVPAGPSRQSRVSIGSPRSVSSMSRPCPLAAECLKGIGR